MANHLTDKQQEFINAYLGKANFNATRAAKLAGYKGNGITLATVGYENLRKHYIAEEIGKRLQANAMSANELISILGRQARSKNIIGQYLTPQGLDIDKFLEDGHGNLIKSMYDTKYGMKIEFVDDIRSQELIGRHLALFVDKSEVVEINGGSLTDFEEWKQAQTNRQSEARETLGQFDEDDQEG